MTVKFPLNKLPPTLEKDLHKNLCTCNEVTKVDIINAIMNGASTVEEVKRQTYATLGIGCCAQQIEQLIEYFCSTQQEEDRL